MFLQVMIELVVDAICLQVEEKYEELPMWQVWESQSTRRYALVLTVSGAFAFSALFMSLFQRIPESAFGCAGIASICSCGCPDALTYPMQQAVCAPLVEAIASGNATIVLPAAFNAKVDLDMAVRFARALVENATVARCVGGVMVL